MDYYTTLGLTPQASKTEINKAYRTLLKKYRMTEDKDAIEALMTAYEELKNVEPTPQDERITNIKYPVFLECSEYTLDDFWVKQFVNLAKGKTPRRVKIRNNNIEITVGKDHITHSLDSDPAELSVNVVQAFWRIGIMSNDDLTMNNPVILEIKESQQPESWKSIKNKELKRSLISNYVKNLEYSTDDRMEIYTLLQTCLAVNDINESDVVLEDGRIVDIPGLVHNETGWHFSFH